jgi:hypothetical protein
MTNAHLSDAPEVERLRKTVDDLKTLHMGAGTFRRDDVEHALSLIDSLKANADEREKIIAMLSRRAS